MLREQSAADAGDTTVDLESLPSSNWVFAGGGNIMVSPSGYIQVANGDSLGDMRTPRAGYPDLVERTREANDRSRELLLRFLTPEQREQFSGERGSSFTTTAPSGRKYEIRWGGIDRLDDKGERICSYCYEPEQSGLPIYDQMLARKLMVEHHEEQVLREGNLVYHRDGIARPGERWFPGGRIRTTADRPLENMRLWDEQFRHLAAEALLDRVLTSRSWTIPAGEVYIRMYTEMPQPDLERERHLGPTATALSRVRQNDT